MGRDAEEWEGLAREHFDFLLEHGFRFAGVDDSRWATSALYLSDTFGVEVTRSAEFNRVEISLIRLVDGAVPEYPIWITDEPVHHSLFDNVLIARSPDKLDQLQSGLSKRAVDHQLREWANLLCSVAPDFLRGDDAPLREAEEVVRQRVAENPQEMTVWLPDDASKRREARARKKAVQDVPPNVAVRMRRYRRKKRSRGQ